MHRECDEFRCIFYSDSNDYQKCELKNKIKIDGDKLRHSALEDGI